MKLLLANLHYYVFLGLLRVTTLLPFELQIHTGRALGKFLFHIMKKRRHIARVNLTLCFPQLNARERNNLVKKVFEQNGIGIVETAMAWWKKPESFRKRTEFIGLDNIKRELEKGKGVILLGAHYSTLDLGGLLVSLELPLHAIYRPHNNPVMEAYLRKGRLKCLRSLIERSDFRSVIKTLKKNEIVWYAPDQDFGEKHSVFADFFGVPAATLEATAKLARLSSASVVPIAHHRTEDNKYRVEFFSALENFPKDDSEASALQINKSIETGILRDVSQYMWIHRRFKTQPNSPKGSVYRQDS